MVFLKKAINYIIICIFSILIVANISKVTFYTKQALITWYDTILPSQFITLVLVGIIKKYQAPKTPHFKFLFIMQLFFYGFLLGFPTGAILASQAYRDGKISRCEAHIIIPACNLFGPAYLFGFVYPTYNAYFMSAFTKTRFLFAIYGIPLIFSGFSLLFISVFCSKNRKAENPGSINTKHFAENNFNNPYQKIVFSEIIITALITASKLAGFMMFFSGMQFIIDLFPLPKSLNLAGKSLFEVSGALQLIAPQFPAFSVFFIIFGCISGIVQTYAILAEFRLSIFPYIIQKCILGILGVIFLTLFP